MLLYEKDGMNDGLKDNADGIRKIFIDIKRENYEILRWLDKSDSINCKLTI